MGDIQGYNVSLRNDISGRLCACGDLAFQEAGSFTLKADYSSGGDNTVAVGCQGTSSANFMRSNLVYTSSGTLDNSIAVGRDSSGGIYLDDAWMDDLCKKIKAINESKDCDEITVPPMRGFIEI